MIAWERTLDCVYRPVMDDALKATLYGAIWPTVIKFPTIQPGDTLSVSYHLKNGGVLASSDNRLVIVHKEISEIAVPMMKCYVPKDVKALTGIFVQLILDIFPRLIEYNHDYVLTASIKTWKRLP